MFQCGHGARKHTDTPDEGAMGVARRSDFAFLFPNADGVPHTAATVALLEDLAVEMAKGTGDPEAENSTTLPAFMTYLGQFLDHDITSQLNTDPAIDTDISKDFVPLERQRVVDGMANQRTGQIDLDSIYGIASPSTDLENRLKGALRHPTFKAKMTIQFPEDVNSANLGSPARVVPPNDGANDILRLGRILGTTITEAELNSIQSKGLREFFFKREADGSESINRHRAIIGDPRNDENLFVAQVHLAWLRLHNRIVDHAPAHLANGPEEDLFAWAQDQTRLLYQGVILSDWLTRICDAEVLQFVLENNAPLYSGLMARMAPAEGVLPMPVEFAFAAFRFGHSMARDAYDWNAEFTNAAFPLMFAFTGSHRNPMFGVTDSRLPSNWPADWARVASKVDPAFPKRATRKIDTHIAPPLGNLPTDAGAEMEQALKNLAHRNLLRSQLVNVPAAQACIATILAETGFSIAPLTEDQLSSGATGGAIQGSDLVSKTPLWFYVLKEAETHGNGECLGPLGSLIVADTIVGLMVHDEKSILNRKNDAGDAWTSADGVMPDGIQINTFQDVLRAALLL